MKGIILAGGTGSRLYPITKSISKQLVPIYDKPMIYYPLSTLMLAGIRDILIISTAIDISRFEALFGTGESIGCNFSYQIQDKPTGLADAFVIGEEFIGDDKVAMILGDNIFYGSEMGDKLSQHTDLNGGLVFGYQVQDPERYGVVEFNDDGKVLSIEEKPETPKSNFAIPGLYFFDNRCVEYAKNANQSARGEKEITEVINAYLDNGELQVQLLDRGTAWLDTGTFESMNQASQFVQVIEERQGLKIGCIEEIAWRNKWIDDEALNNVADELVKSGYGKYLKDLLIHG
jgi:glucose-1-phosphate thymidylyltransferase